MNLRTWGIYTKDTYMYLRVNVEKNIIVFGYTTDLNKKDTKYSSKALPFTSKYHTVSNVPIEEPTVTKIFIPESEKICKSLGGTLIDVINDFETFLEFNFDKCFQFDNESSFRHACDSISSRINEIESQTI